MFLNAREFKKKYFNILVTIMEKEKEKKEFV